MKNVISIAAACVVGGTAFGQTCVPEWGQGFPNPTGFNEEVRAVAVFDDGTGPAVYAGGQFTQINGQGISGIARWTGAAWGPVGEGLTGTPYWLGVLDNGSGPALYVGGGFTSTGGTPASNIAKWDGARWAALAAGTDGVVRAATAFDDGSGPAIYAVGAFDHAGGAPAAGIARWDGATWAPVGGGLTMANGEPAETYAIGVFDVGDGPKLYAGGRFDQAGATKARRVARWDGRSWSGLGDGLFGATSPFVMALRVFDDGNGPRLYAGGRISTSASEPERARVVRWTGSQWVQVGSDLSPVLAHYANSLVVLPGTAGPELFVGGFFSGATWLNGVNYVARLASGEWTGVDGGMSGSYPYSYVRTLTVSEGPGGPVMYAGGAFTAAGAAVANHVARWDGERWSSLETYTGLTKDLLGEGLVIGVGNAMCTFDDGTGERLFVGGEFSGAGGKVTHGIAAWNGEQWSPVGSGVTVAPGVPGRVHALELHDDGSGMALYAGGYFTSAGGGPSFGIARWDGAHWSSLGGSGVDGTVRALASHDDGSGPAIFVGGSFTNAGSLLVNRIARWDGVEWAALGSGLPAWVTYPNGMGGGSSSGTSIQSLAVFDDGTGSALFAGGAFNSIGGVPAKSIARWDGAGWSSIGDLMSPPPQGWYVRAMAVYDDGLGPNLYAAGMFFSAAGVPVQNVARWDGQSWRAVGHSMPNAPPSPVSSLAIFDERSGPALYVGTETFSGSPGYTGGVFRWNGSQWFKTGVGVGTGPFSYVRVAAMGSLGYGDAGSLFVSGNFTQVAGQPTGGFAEWRGCPPCRADCNHDGVLDAADFSCFQTEFTLGGGSGECNGDGALTVADFSCFQTAFVTGAPEEVTRDR